MHVYSLLNSRSLKNKTLYLNDYITTHKYDLVAFTETWFNSTDNNESYINALVPDGYAIQHVDRDNGQRGGGVALIHRTSIKLKKEKIMKFNQFEVLMCLLNLNNTVISMFIIYRPPPTQQNRLSAAGFLVKFSEFISKYIITKTEIIITGDINIHLDVSTDSHTRRFTEILESCDLHQYINVPTHCKGHTLDILVSSANWHILLAVCEQHRDSIDKDIAASIVNLSLKRNCEDYLSRLLPISSALDKMQAAQCSIGTSVEIWKDLAEQLSKCLSKEEVSKFEKRMNANLTPHHFLANLLTPQYQGKRLTQAQLDSALDLCSQYPSTLPTVMEYQARTERFKEFRFSSDVLGSVAPLTWWRAANPPVTVMNLVASLLTAINSSASIERVFSTFGLVHSKVRNKLGVDKAGKLVFIYRMLNTVPANAIEYY